MSVMLSVKEVSARYNIPIRTIRNLRANGTIPADAMLKIGRHIRFDQEKLEACFKAKAIESLERRRA